METFFTGNQWFPVASGLRGASRIILLFAADNTCFSALECHNVSVFVNLGTWILIRVRGKGCINVPITVISTYSPLCHQPDGHRLYSSLVLLELPVYGCCDSATLYRSCGLTPSRSPFSPQFLPCLL